MNLKMRTEKELQQIHDQMQGLLLGLINDGLKFEICVSTARHIIRTDYHTINPDNISSAFQIPFKEETITLMIDPSSTPKKVYMEIIDNIYNASNLPKVIKDSPNLTKEQKLILLLEIHYLHHYKGMSQVQIGKYISEHKIAGLHDINEHTFSKEVHRFIIMSNAIKSTYNIISPNKYLT